MDERREHPGLFRRKTWAGIEVDFTAILQTVLTLFVLMLMLGIPQWMIVVRMERMVMNQVIIKENDVKIIDNQTDLMRNQNDMIKGQSAIIALITMKMTAPCTDCHRKRDIIGRQSFH